MKYESHKLEARGKRQASWLRIMNWTPKPANQLDLVGYLVLRTDKTAGAFTCQAQPKPNARFEQNPWPGAPTTQKAPPSGMCFSHQSPKRASLAPFTSQRKWKSQLREYGKPPAIYRQMLYVPLTAACNSRARFSRAISFRTAHN